MYKTKVTIEGEDFYINGEKTYSEFPNAKPKMYGLLMNARFIQGVFEDKADPVRFNRFGKMFDVNKNTDDLIAELPKWYKWGLRAFTVGLQGGGPCFSMNNSTINCNPFSVDGHIEDKTCFERLDRLIKAADEIGMVVIVSYFYPGQTHRLESGAAVIQAVKESSCFLKEKGYTNVLIEVCNECDLVKEHPLIGHDEGMPVLIEIAREESGGMLVSTSFMGGRISPQIAAAGDFVTIHGNGQSKTAYEQLIRRAREYAPGVPVVCNEDSPANTKSDISVEHHVSWGYYNNLSKQEPPTNWAIHKGLDSFFMIRVAKQLGIDTTELEDKELYFRGFEKDEITENLCWPRVEAMYPEKIYKVEFYKDGELLQTSYDEPFAYNQLCDWSWGRIGRDLEFERRTETRPTIICKYEEGDETKWVAKVYMHSGEVIEMTPYL